MNYRKFLLNEENNDKVRQNEQFAARIGGVLEIVHRLEDQYDHINRRQVVSDLTQVANEIRTIIHSTWPPSHQEWLKDLVRIGVASMRATEDNSNTQEVVGSIADALEQLSAKLGFPIQ